MTRGKRKRLKAPLASKMIKRTGPKRVLGSIEHVLVQLELHQRVMLRSRMRFAATALAKSFKTFERQLSWMERRIDKATRPKRKRRVG